MLKHDASYTLEKSVWNEDDFEQMGWHDARIHAISFDPEGHRFFLDIDYIYEWVEPAPGVDYFSFWVSPCTLVFRDVYAVEMAVETTNELDIIALQRRPARHVSTDEIVADFWDWTLECDGGKISFSASGFTQYTRREPQHISGQFFDWQERGGASFAHFPIPHLPT